MFHSKPNPELTIKYFKNIWSSEPEAKIIKSTDSLLIFEFDNKITEYHEIKNNNEVQELLIVEDGKSNILTKNLSENKIFVDGGEVQVKISNISEEIHDEDINLKSGTWGNKQLVKRYTVTWQKELADLTTSALAAILITSVTTLTGGAGTFLAAAVRINNGEAKHDISLNLI